MRSLLTSLIAAAVLWAVPAQAQTRIAYCHVEVYQTAAEMTASDHSGCRLTYAVDTDLFYFSGGLSNPGTMALTGDLTLSGGASALTFSGSASSIVLDDNDTTALLIGSTDQLNLMTFDTGNDTETVVITGTTAADALHVDTGTAQFDENVDFGGGIDVTGNITVTGAITGAGFTSWKSYGASDPGNAQTFYLAGSYMAPTAETALNQGALTQTYGSANNGYGAHAFFVAKGDGATDGTDLVLTVSGVSITDAGVKNDADTEVIVGTGAATTGCTAGGELANLATDVYCETAKKWLGQITYTLSSSGGATYNLSGNYGLAKYEDFGNKDFTLTDAECVYLAGANESNFGIRYLHHSSSDWTYSAAAFAPGGTVVATLDTDYGDNDEFDTGEKGAFKRAGLSTSVTGSGLGGVIIEISYAVNNSVANIDCHLGVTF